MKRKCTRKHVWWSWDLPGALCACGGARRPAMLEREREFKLEPKPKEKRPKLRGVPVAKGPQPYRPRGTKAPCRLQRTERSMSSTFGLPPKLKVNLNPTRKIWDEFYQTERIAYLVEQDRDPYLGRLILIHIHNLDGTEPSYWLYLAKNAPQWARDAVNPCPIF